MLPPAYLRAATSDLGGMQPGRDLRRPWPGLPAAGPGPSPALGGPPLSRWHGRRSRLGPGPPAGADCDRASGSLAGS